MPSDDLSKKIFVGSSVAGAILLLFLVGDRAARGDRSTFSQITALVGQTLFPTSPKYEHLQPTRDQGSGVTVNKRADDTSLIMMSGFFDDENQVRLVRRDGAVIRKWSLDYFAHFANRDDRVCDVDSHLGVDVHGAHLNRKGELAFNYEYCGTVKVDQCGNVMWTLSEPTHHSIVEASSDGYWILGRNYWLVNEAPDSLAPFSGLDSTATLDEDTLLRVSADGDILDEISIPIAMKESGLEAVLTANNRMFRRDRLPRREIVHANQAVELSAEIADKFPLFEAGDVAISMRGLNLVVVMDPETRQIKWHQTGPWLRQHDAEFRADGRISVFNNNTYFLGYLSKMHMDIETPRTSNIIVMDPVTRETEVVFGQRAGQEMLSVIRGQHTLLDDGGMLISEFDGGRVLEVDSGGEIVWEYVNAYDDDWVGEIANAFVFEPDYFETDWKKCE